MHLTQHQIETFERDGYLFFSNHFQSEEIARPRC